MNEIAKGLFSAPLPTVLIIAGMIFLLIAVVGDISGKIQPGAKGRLFSGVLGAAFVLVGLTIHFTQPQHPLGAEDPPTAPKTEASPALHSEPPRKPLPGKSEGPVEVPASASVPSAEEKEPNDLPPSATPIALGKTVRGSIARGDRDTFRFQTGPEGEAKIRVILRKRTLPGWAALVTVYDAAERKVGSSYGGDTEPASLGFESLPNSVYYVEVKPAYSGRGDYELTVRREDR